MILGSNRKQGVRRKQKRSCHKAGVHPQFWVDLVELMDYKNRNRPNPSRQRYFLYCINGRRSWGVSRCWILLVQFYNMLSQMVPTSLTRLAIAALKSRGDVGARPSWLVPPPFSINSFNFQGEFAQFRCTWLTWELAFLFFLPRVNTLDTISQPLKISFPRSFLNFVLKLNPNLKWDPSDITPTWDL